MTAQHIFLDLLCLHKSNFTISANFNQHSIHTSITKQANNKQNGIKKCTMFIKRAHLVKVQTYPCNHPNSVAMDPNWAG